MFYSCWWRVCTVLLCLASAAPATAQSAPPLYIFSERVGEAIDPDERAYFGLFPEVEASASAQAFATGDSVAVAFTRSVAPDTTVTMARTTAEALGRFIETFEQAETAFYNPHWQYVAGFARADVPVPHVEPRRDVLLDVGERRYSGTVLVATDSLVLIQSAAEPYDWRGRNALTLRTAEIERVAFGRRGWEQYGTTAPLAAGGAGALLGITGAYLASNDLDATAQRAWSVPVLAVLGHELARRFWPRPTPSGTLEERRGPLRERARFDAERRPYDLPDIAEFEGRESYRYEPVPPPPSSGVFREWYRRYGVVSVGIMGGGVVTSPEASAYTEFLRGIGARERDHLRNAHDVDGGVDLSLRPLPWVRIGGTWQARNDTEEAGIGVEVVNVTPSALRGYAEVVIPSPEFRGLRFDVGVGAGLESHDMSVERAVEDGASQETAYREERSWTNIFWQGTAELFTSKHASFFLRVTHRAPSNTIPIEGVEIAVSGLPDTISYRIDPHEVSFGAFTELMWGTRLHL